MNIDQMLDDILRREGGFVDDPADRGGRTNFGITQATLDAWLGPAGPGDVAALTEGDAKVIYRSFYYLDPGIDRLPEPWQPLVLDWAVHSGPAVAIKELQKLCCEEADCDPGPVDGVIGPRTIAAAQALLHLPLRMYLDRRRRFCAQICEARPDQVRFIKGWMARIDELDRRLHPGDYDDGA